MRVIGVRTDKPAYPSNVYGGGVITITATVQVDPMESGMYKLQAFIKKDGESPASWTKAGYEQWGSPRTTCISGIPGVKSMCGDDVRVDIPSPVGFGKFIVTVININEMNDTAGETIDGVVKTTGAHATFQVLPMDSPTYGLLKVMSNPSGATIVVDGIDSGRTTAAGASQDFALAAGTHSVTLSKMGYQTYRKDAVVVARETVQVFTKLTPGAPSGTGASFAIYGSPYSAWGDEYNLVPTTYSPANPLYKSSAPSTNPLTLSPSSTPTPPVYSGRPFAVESQDPLQVALGSLGNVGSAVAVYTPYIALAAAGAFFIYMMSKPKIRGKVTEYAARGGVAARAGIGGVREAARAAKRGFEEGKRVPGMTEEEIGSMIGESIAKRAREPPSLQSLERQVDLHAGGGYIPDVSPTLRRERRMTWLNGKDKEVQNGVKRARKITLMMEE